MFLSIFTLDLLSGRKTYLTRASTPVVLEAFFAQAFVGAGGVLAATVQATDARAVDAAFVDVDAVLIRPVDVPRRTETVITAQSVFADLTLAALMDSFATFVYVEAMLTGYLV